MRTIKPAIIALKVIYKAKLNMELILFILLLYDVSRVICRKINSDTLSYNLMNVVILVLGALESFDFNNN
jgi:hypothetical protein